MISRSSCSRLAACLICIAAQVTLSAAPVFINTPGSLPGATLNQPYSETLAGAGGTRPYTYSLASGTLPTGLNLSSSGVISGTPSAAGNSSFSVKLTDAASASTTRSYTLNVAATPLTISATSNVTAYIGQFSSFGWGSTGGTSPYNFSIVSGSLPPGLQFTSSNCFCEAGGFIYGTPTRNPGTYNITVLTTDANGRTASAPVRIVLNAEQPLTDTSPAPPTLTVGANYSYQLSTSGGYVPITWSLASGSLPGGLQLTSDGEIRGVPANTGSGSFTVQARDGLGASVSRVVSIPSSTPTALTITTTSQLPTGVVNKAYSKQLVALGGSGSYNWATVGNASLPPGLSLDSSSGLISGTPATAGSYSFQVGVFDGRSETSASKAFQMTISSSQFTIPGPLGTLPPADYVGQALQYGISPNSGGGIAGVLRVVQGSLPPGWQQAGVIALAGTGIIAGTSNFTVEYKSTDGQIADQTASIQVLPTPALTLFSSNNLPNGIVGSNYYYTDFGSFSGYNQNGGAHPYTWSVGSGALPPGLVLYSDGELVGIPTTEGIYTFVLQVTDGNNNIASRQVQLQILPYPSAPAFTNTSLPTFINSSTVNYAIPVTGGVSPYFFQLTSGSLPSGYSLNSSSGALSGGPSSITGNFPIQVQVTDSSPSSEGGPFTAVQNFTFTLVPPLTFTTTSPLRRGDVGSPYSQTIGVTGGAPPYVFDWSTTPGPIPPGLSINSSTGLISGTPSGSPGAYSLVIRVVDSTEQVIQNTFNLTINGPLVLSANPPPSGVQGVNYNFNLTSLVSGGTAPYFLSLTSGNLPPGLSISSNTILGSCTGTGTASPGITVQDAANATTSQTYSMGCNPYPAITTNLPDGVAGQPYSQQFATNALYTPPGAAPYSWSITSGSLPPGLTFDSTTGILSGTPTTAGPYNFTAQFTDRWGDTATKQMSLTIEAPLVISTASPLPAGTAGIAYSQPISATGGATPYIWSIASGTLPAGLTLNSASGVLSGTTNSPNTYSFVVQVADAATHLTTKVFSVTFGAPSQVVISTVSPLASGTVGAPYNASIVGSGGTSPYTWAVTGGAIPPGLVFNPVTVTGSAPAASLSGTPTTPGTYIFNVQLTGSVTSDTVTNSFTVTINPPLAITTSGLPNGEVNAPYNATVATTGGTSPLGWALSSGSLPPGLTLNSNGTITGTPTTAGASSFVIQVADTAGASATRALTIAISPVLTITTSSTLPPGETGAGYSQSLAAAGGQAPYLWSTSGALPAGLSLASSGILQLVGATFSTPGTYTFSVTVQDANAVSISKTLSLTVAAGPSISTTSLPAGTVGIAYNQTLAAAGGTPPYSWTATGLPAGLALSSSGVLSGTPSSPGSATISVTLTDAAAVSVTSPVSLVINPPQLVITTVSPLPVATAGAAYTQTLTGGGGIRPYSWTATGLPGWLTLTSSGVLSGTPPQPGNITFGVTLTDAANVNVTAQITLPVNAPPLLITTAPTLPIATVGTAYNQPLAATGGTPPYQWSATGLPTGISLNSAGVLTGTPATAGSFPFTVTVADAAEKITSLLVTLPVNPAALQITNVSPLPAAMAGTAYVQTLTGAGGTPAYTWTATGLPGWLTLSPAGVLSGTPPSPPAPVTFTVTLADSASRTVSSSFVLPVNPATLQITTASPLPAATVGSAYSQTFASVGGVGPYTWTATGLPGWLKLTTAGVLSGTPPNTTPVTFSVTVTDSARSTAQMLVTINVNPAALLISTQTPLSTATEGVPYTQTLSGTGGVTPYTWSATGLPAWLTLSESGVLSGTPPVSTSTPRSVTFTVVLTDAIRTITSLPFTLPINLPGLQILTVSPLPGAIANQPYQQTLTSSGGIPPYVWSAAGLPPWLTVSPNGLLSGTPPDRGVFNFLIAVTDAAQTSIAQPVSLTVTALPLSITTGSPLPAATVGAAYSGALSATGGVMPYNWSVSGGSLPPGIALRQDGTLAGQPTVPGKFSFTAVVTDVDNSTVSTQFTLEVQTVAPANPSITTPGVLPFGTTGTPYTASLAAIGGQGPYSWSVFSGSLPAGLSISPSGVISGTPAVAQLSIFGVQVIDISGKLSSSNFSLLITDPALPAIISASPLPDGVQGNPYSYQFSAAGGQAPYFWAIRSGLIPDGLTFDPQSGILSGTPTTTGSFSLAVSVADSASATISGSPGTTFTLVIKPPTGFLISTPSTLPNATVGSVYNQTLTPTGGKAPLTWLVLAGQLPSGLSFDPATGTLFGTPLTPGLASFVIEASDAAQQLAVKPFTLFTVDPRAPAILPVPLLPNGTVGQTYSAALSAAGGASPYTWTLSNGSLPPGVSLDPASGSLAGTPSSAGLYRFSISITDRAGASSSRQFSLQIAAPGLTITTASLPDATAQLAYSQGFAATGGVPPYHWSLAAGGLPGLSLDPATGLLTGTAPANGPLNFTVFVTDSSQQFATASFRLNIASRQLSISANLPAAVLGQPYSAGFSATQAVFPVTWSLAGGNLPSGLSLDAGSGTLSGTPTATGVFTFTIAVTDASGQTATQDFTLAVNPTPLVITTTSLSPVTAGGGVSQNVLATGGTPPYQFSVSGNLPPGITLNSAGLLTGTSIVPGSYRFIVTVVDSQGTTATQNYQIDVAPPTLSPVTLTGLQSTSNAGDQAQIALSLASGYPIAISGTATLTFIPAPNLPDVSDLAFSNGERVIGFSLAPGATQLALPVQLGTVAGTVSISFTLLAGQVDITPSGLNRSTQISPGPPVISTATFVPVSGGLQVSIIGFSDTRELRTATFTFNPSPTSNIQASQFTIDVSSVFTSWFQTAQSLPLGGQFLYTQPFTIGGALNAIQSFTVTLTNSAGTSATKTVNVQ